MPNFSLLTGLHRVRIALMIAGLAWMCGLDAPLYLRLAIGGLVLGAFVLEAAIDEKSVQHLTTTPAPPRGHYDHAA